MSRALCTKKGLSGPIIDALESAGINLGNVVALIEEFTLPIASKFLAGLLSGAAPASDTTTVSPASAATGLLLVLAMFFCSTVYGAETPAYRDDCPSYAPSVESYGDTFAKTLDHFDYTCKRSQTAPAPAVAPAIAIAVSKPAAVEIKTTPAYRPVCTAQGCYLTAVGEEVPTPPAAFCYGTAYATEVMIAAPSPLPAPSTYRHRLGIHLGGETRSFYIGFARKQ